jgi:hypothetical protein
LKTIVILLLLALTTSVANAETYKWEDASGVHFTDNLSSVPEKYREKHAPEATVQNKAAAPQLSTGMAQQFRPAVMQPYLPPAIQPAIQQYQQDQAAAYQANLEQQRRAAEVMRQQQARALAVSARNVEKASNSFAKFMAFWLLMGFGLMIAWVSTIVDIVRSEFVSPSNKTVWMLLVIFLPMLGMILYFMMGQGQKHKTTNFDKNNKWNSNYRDNRRDYSGKI